MITTANINLKLLVPNWGPGSLPLIPDQILAPDCFWKQARLIGKLYEMRKWYTILNPRYYLPILYVRLKLQQLTAQLNYS